MSKVSSMVPSVNSLSPMSLESNAILHKQLKENVEAMAYLKELGISSQTIDRFYLGLSSPYVDKNGVSRSCALTFPLMNKNFSPCKKYGYCNIPGVTVNPVGQGYWATRGVFSYYSDIAAGKRAIFVCAGVKDLWCTWQFLENHALGKEILLISSSHDDQVPMEWNNPEFWEGYERIYLGQYGNNVGDTIAHDLAESICRDTYRVKTPGTFETWCGFWNSCGSNIETFQKLLSEASVISHKINRPQKADQLGRLPYDPIDVNGAYHNGYLYYPATVLHRRQEIIKDQETGEEKIEIVEHKETVVIRSDRAVLSVKPSNAPKGTPAERRVIRLTDGTLVDREPTPNKHGSWSWGSINKYLEASDAAPTKTTRALSEIVSDVSSYLKDVCWLPYEDDHTILALVAVATYTQEIFDAVPLLLATGPKGSGKTELGQKMADICANGKVLGQASAATIARLIDETRGFVVLDDMESISSKDGQFSELMQCLKLSYKKASAKKAWTDTKTMTTQMLNFYGVKMINNTSGVESILGSRMLYIQTRKRSKEEWELYQQQRNEKAAGDPILLAKLRDELHTWAFENVQAVSERYKSHFSSAADRFEEICAPLRVIACLTGDETISATLDQALKRQLNRESSSDDPVEIMHEALKNLISNGFTQVAITHLLLEMKTLLPADYGKEHTTDIAEWARPEWIGRQLRSHDLITGQAMRKRVAGSNLRIYEVQPTFVDIVRQQQTDEESVSQVQGRDPGSFCSERCPDCQYHNVDCPLREAVLKSVQRENSKRKRP